MQDRRHLIELIHNLSKQESAQQPTAEEWLHEQDEKARNSAAPAPAAAEPPDAGGTPDKPNEPTTPDLPDPAGADPMSTDDHPNA